MPHATLHRRPFLPALLLASAASATFAATNTYIGPSGGSYSTPGNWSLGLVPTNGNGGQNYDVVINSAPGVTVAISSSSPTIDTLTIAAANALTIANSRDLSINGTTSNNGLITLAAATSLTNLTFNNTGATLTGAGTLLLASDDISRTNARVYGAAGNRLTSSNTILGTGQLGLNLLKFTNTALISATSLGGITIDPQDAADGFINTGGTLRADGADLRLSSSTYTNTGGLIDALGTSRVFLNSGAVVAGGTLQTSAAGQILLDSARLQNLTTTGNLVINNAADGFFNGAINNSGSILLNASASLTNLSISNTDTTFSGGGTITLATDNVTRANARITGASGNRLTSDNPILGTGSIGLNLIKITNNASITATAGLGITIDPIDTADGFINNGTLSANGGPLLLSTSTYTNNGVIDARNASVTTISGSASILGGTLTTSAGGTISFAGGTLQNVSSAAQVVVPNSALGILSGTFTNNGTLTVAGGPSLTDLSIGAGTVTLAGTGPLLLTTDLTSRANARIFGASSALLISSNPISGTGFIGLNLIRITNNSSITATTGLGITIDPIATADGFTNNGTLSANGAPLLLSTGTYTNNGVIEARNASVTSLASGVAITGGTLTTADTATISLVSASLNNLALQGTASVPNNGIATLVGTITNTGTLTVAAGTSLTDLSIGAADVSLAGAGQLILATDSTTRANARILGAASTRLTSANPISGTGAIGLNLIKLTNNSSITATVGLGITIDTVNTADAFINNGTLSANGAPLLLSTSTLTNNGIIEARNASVTTLASGIAVTGGTLTTADTASISLASASLNNLALQGAASIPNNGIATLIGTIVNDGTLTVAAGASLTDLSTGAADVSLTGAGLLRLTTDAPNRANARILGTSGTRLTTSVPISGAGQIGLNLIKISASAPITANLLPGITIDPINAADGFSSTALLRADGAPLTFNSSTYTLSGPVDATNGGTVTFAAGTFTLSAPVTFSSNSTVNFDAAAISALAITGTGTLSVGGTLISDTVSGVAAWNVTGTHQLRLHTGTSKVDVLPNIVGGRLNINDNGLIIQATANKAAILSTLQGYIAAGNANNPGITSATSLADSVHRGNVAVDNAILGLTTFFGLPVDANSLLVESTYKGDTNLDRKVNVTDLGVLATYYGQNVAGFGVLHGDFNNDNLVNVSDLGILATDYGLGTSGPPYALEADLSHFPQLTAAVPEPASLALLTPTALLLIRRRRTR